MLPWFALNKLCSRGDCELSLSLLSADITHLDHHVFLIVCVCVGTSVHGVSVDVKKQLARVFFLYHADPRDGTLC